MFFLINFVFLTWLRWYYQMPLIGVIGYLFEQLLKEENDFFRQFELSSHQYSYLYLWVCVSKILRVALFLQINIGVLANSPRDCLMGNRAVSFDTRIKIQKMKLLKAFLRTSYPLAIFTLMIFVMHYFGARSQFATMIVSFSIIDWLVYTVGALAVGTALRYYFEEE